MFNTIAIILVLPLPYGNAIRVKITDIVVGDGAAAATGKGVVLKWVMRRSNGYYVSSSSEGDGEPFVYRVSNMDGGSLRNISGALICCHWASTCNG